MTKFIHMQYKIRQKQKRNEQDSLNDRIRENIVRRNNVHVDQMI